MVAVFLITVVLPSMRKLPLEGCGEKRWQGPEDKVVQVVRLRSKTGQRSFAEKNT